MRSVWMIGVGLAIGCNPYTPDGPEWGPSSDGDAVQWSDGDYEQFAARFGGEFTVDPNVEDPTDEGSTNPGNGNGGEYQVITDAFGDVACDFRWQTDAFDVPYVDAGCADCTRTFDVTCYDGREEAGDCWGFMDTQAAAEPMQFELSFEPTAEQDGVQTGVVYVGDSQTNEWYEYAQGTFDGSTVRYETQYTFESAGW